jgi:hypothetical protein
MQRKQQVGECWVCVIFFARVVVSALCRVRRGGFEEIVLPRETCHIFASFFVFPQFLCPLLGGFSAHGFLPMVFYFQLRN